MSNHIIDVIDIGGGSAENGEVKDTDSDCWTIGDSTKRGDQIGGELIGDEQLLSRTAHSYGHQQILLPSTCPKCDKEFVVEHDYKRHLEGCKLYLC